MKLRVNPGETPSGSASPPENHPRGGSRPSSLRPPSAPRPEPLRAPIPGSFCPGRGPLPRPRARRGPRGSVPGPCRRGPPGVLGGGGPGRERGGAGDPRTEPAAPAASHLPPASAFMARSGGAGPGPGVSRGAEGPRRRPPSVSRQQRRRVGRQKKGWEGKGRGGIAAEIQAGASHRQVPRGEAAEAAGGVLTQSEGAAWKRDAARCLSAPRSCSGVGGWLCAPSPETNNG